ncbi:hypothetical protein M3P21_05980 [Ruegeria sp. 2012CJ41-6]|uniref:DUF2730 family protein n=1 Tax=Ruegeria spongiae TaxID=2942209 RepID=A0ABT0Q0D6_9RHOB|nr:hypothetical protein [Ruegeria spongiae]MCL6283077.1 hypothetical protein [Ruegeria spongiae]
MAKTLKDLVLALLNATLILLALCLFLAWKTVDGANQIADTVEKTVQAMTPVRTGMQEVVAQLEGLRGDLDALDKETSLNDLPQLAEIQSQLDALSVQLSEAQMRIDDLSDRPGQLLDEAITATADAVATRLAALRGCVPAPS